MGNERKGCGWVSCAAALRGLILLVVRIAHELQRTLLSKRVNLTRKESHLSSLAGPIITDDSAAPPPPEHSRDEPDPAWSARGPGARNSSR
ncbi:unnamed protein product [Heligmosomoides polygyrus]|uniref:Secreted protein n=1 Tax=Heligmosomoides polygyrus TaxID=6339 RepID=A0A183F6T3_HELPZ|nr:unnamed protein product [Heligmosomoides polygyrus]